MSEHESAHDVDTGGKKVRAETGRRVVESAEREKLTPETIERLELDLLMDQTASWRRVNFEYINDCFLSKPGPLRTHWRLAKIMDAMVVMSKDIGITIRKPGAGGKTSDFQLKPENIPTGIYEFAEEKKLDEKNWEVVMKPSASDGQPKTFKASMADFAHLLDVFRVNEELGSKRKRLDELAFQYFRGDTSIKTGVMVKNKDGSEAELDLLDHSKNPRDDYKVLNFQEYLDTIKLRWRSLSNLGGSEFRFELPSKTGHRENSCHAVQTEVHGILEWIPTSGELAQQMSMEDILKRQPNENYKGQPHEFMAMAETSEGGPCIKAFRRALDQRQGLNAQNIGSATNSRTAKQMVGLTLLEQASTKSLPLGEKGEMVKVIDLCGEKCNLNVVKGEMDHHNKFRARIGLPPLNDKEAADMVFTDVFAPIILKNPVDWIIQIARIYGVASVQAVANLGNNKFRDFVVRMWCLELDPKNPDKIVQKPFSSMRDIIAYALDRLRAGHIPEGPLGEDALPDVPMPPESGGPAGGEQQPREISITKENGKQFGEVIKKILGRGYSSYFYEYVDGIGTFPPMRADDNSPLRPDEEGRGAKKKAFEKILENEMDSMPDRALLAELLKPLGFTIEEEEDSDRPAEEDLEKAIEGFIKALKGLDPDARGILKGK